jgi:putative spermidine/putrescine transport system ATP-binding protein
MRGFLSVDGVTKRYGNHTALSAASFSAERGEILALLGPSGCGKTTLLNLIAGFLDPNEGRIRVADRDLAGVPPNRRDMGMVFQNYALFPHLTVEKNVSFGLEAHGVPRAERRTRIAEALSRVALAEHGARYPHELSGGQQQRVSLARALVVRPSILLLDEPLSNLDTQLRRAMAEDVREILRAAEMTAVLVTHDQEEALVIADRVLLLSGGRIEQVGSPEDVYERPRTLFGARFMEATNFIEGIVARADAAGVAIRAPFGTIETSACDVSEGERVTVMIRPERIHIVSTDDGRRNAVDGRVSRTNYHGTYRRFHIAVEGQELTVDAPVSTAPHAPGEAVRLAWSRNDTHVLAP